MKHILIILSILSLSSPLFGDKHKGEILYKWKTSSGEVWMGFVLIILPDVYYNDHISLKFRTTTLRYLYIFQENKMYLQSFY